MKLTNGFETIVVKKYTSNDKYLTDETETRYFEEYRGSYYMVGDEDGSIWGLVERD